MEGMEGWNRVLQNAGSTHTAIHTVAASGQASSTPELAKRDILEAMIRSATRLITVLPPKHG